MGVSERMFDGKADRFDAEDMATLFDDDTRSPDDRRTGPLGDAPRLYDGGAAAAALATRLPPHE